jgi:flagellar hook protein FlgE
MQIGSVDQLYTQGNIETTGQSTDLAIQGDSLFVVRKGNQSYYTRSGNFQLDADGKLVSPTNGFVVQGRMYENGQLKDGIQDIKLPFGQKVSAKPTTEMVVGGNLNAASPVFVGDFDAEGRANPANQKAWTETSLSVFDSQGTKWDVKIQFWKTGPNTWEYKLDPKVSAATVDFTVDGDFQLPTSAATGLPDGYEILPENVSVTSPSGTPYNNPDDFTVDGTGKVVFGASIPDASQVKISYHMNPTTPDAGTNSGTLRFDAAGTIIPPADQPAIDFAVPGALPVKVKLAIGSGVNGLTQFATASTAVLRDQNGYTAGQLQNFSIDRTGSSPASSPTARRRRSARSCSPTSTTRPACCASGDNMYQESANSGGAVLGFALEGSQSQMTSGALEMSNVDLAQEFTNMIIAQRGFQANSKVVTTADEMLQELMQLKR